MAGPILGVDTGGTFTDLVLADGDVERVHKLPSTPPDPGRAVAQGAREVGALAAGTTVVHGTTVALNALLTGRVAPAALVTNRGFRDLIEVRRQTRPDIYDLAPQVPPPLVARARRFEVDERVWPAVDDPSRLERVTRADDAELARLAERIGRSGARAVAVCLLHSYADPSDERRVAAALADLGLPITCSAELLPEHREYERFETAIVNAALAPVVSAYLDRLAAALEPAHLTLITSRGGRIAATRAASEPVRVVLSGPAGGVVGAVEAARDAGFERLVALDMGGTSTDVAFAATRPLAAGEARATTDLPEVAGHPIGVPCLDLHTVGCGGGSLAQVDAGGGLTVGPQSAGADPGPVCYGRSDVPTVTDAHVRLGHVAGGRFLGGSLELDLDAVARAFEELGRRLEIGQGLTTRHHIVRRLAPHRVVLLPLQQKETVAGRGPQQQGSSPLGALAHGFRVFQQGDHLAVFAVQKRLHRPLETGRRSQPATGRRRWSGFHGWRRDRRLPLRHWTRIRPARGL